MAKIVVSEKYKLIGQDVAKIGRGAALAGVGAGIVYFLENIGSVDFGEWAPIATALFAILGNAFRKWISENKYK